MLCPTDRDRVPVDYTLRPLWVGGYVVGLLRERSAGVVVAKFERSLYLRFEAGVFVCVGAPGIGVGPLNLLLYEYDWPRADKAALGQRVAVAGDTLRLGDNLVIALPADSLWLPHGLDPQRCAAGITQRLCDLTELAHELAPDAGLSWLSFAPARHPNTDPMSLLARPGWDALECWVAQSLNDAYSLEPPSAVSALIGLGPGLTPSGDDVFCGVLIALHALGRERAAAALWAWLKPQLAGRTSDLSAAHLAAAAQGQGHCALHEVLESLAYGENALEPELRRLGQVGHCSGWDALAGAALVLQALAASQPTSMCTASSAA